MRRHSQQSTSHSQSRLWIAAARDLSHCASLVDALAIPTLDPAGGGAAFAASSLPVDEPFTTAQAHEWGVSDAELRAFVTPRCPAPGGPRRYGERGGAGHHRISGRSPVAGSSRNRRWSRIARQPGSTASRSCLDQHAASMPPLSMYQRTGTRVRRPGIDGGTRQLLDRDVTLVRGIQVTTPLRTALDLGRILWRFDALAAMDGFVQDWASRSNRCWPRWTDSKAFEVSFNSGTWRHWPTAALNRLVNRRFVSIGTTPVCRRPNFSGGSHDDHGVPIYRLDIALPDCMFCAEYDGIEFHSDPGAVKHDVERRDWLANRRSWKIVVFRHENVYGQVPDATSRLAAAYNQIRGRSWT